MSTKGDKGTSAGAKRGSKPQDNPDAKQPIGLNESTGEFNVGEKIIFGTSNGNIRIMRSPHGETVEVNEAVLAQLMIDAFFSDKLKDQYKTVLRT